MTLLEDICQVHDGVLKAPPLTDYGNVLQNSFVRDLAYFTYGAPYDHERIFNEAKEMGIEAVRIMQLASKNIEKEQREIKQEAEDKKASNARTLYDVVNHDEQESCKTCADSNECNPHKNVTWCINWNERVQKPVDNHPISVFRTEHDKPVFSYVSREMSGLDDAEDARKAKAALNREAKKEPDYVFEVGLVLGTVRPK